MDRLRRKFDTAKAFVPKPILVGPGCARGIFAFGSSDSAVVEARDILAEGHGKPSDYLRLRALPFTDEVTAFLAAHEVIYVVEQNRDAQMAGLLKNFYPQFATRLHSVLHYDSTAITAQGIVDQITANEK